MERAKAIDALAQGLGITTARIDLVATELEQACLVDEDWDAEACALLCLRVLVPTLPLDEFMVQVAWAQLDGIAVQEIGANWRVQGEAACETPYSQQWQDAPFLVGALAMHLRAAARGWTSRIGYPFVLSISVHEFTDSRFAELALRFDPPATYAPVTCSLIYGDTKPWALNQPPINSHTMTGLDLCWLFLEMRCELAPNREPSRFEFLASAIVPDDLAFDRMLATHMAAKTVTLH